MDESAEKKANMDATESERESEKAKENKEAEEDDALMNIKLQQK